jgi:hypothetical protein
MSLSLPGKATYTEAEYLIDRRRLGTIEVRKRIQIPVASISSLIVTEGLHGRRFM